MFSRILAVVISAGAAASSLAQVAPADAGADLIVFNAKVATGNRSQPTASALAVKSGRIYFVGSDAEVIALKGPTTRLIDAGNRRLIPGISDAHTHIVNDSGFNYNVRWDGVPTLRRALEMLTEQEARTPDGQWVKVIGGWSPYQFQERRFPSMDEINGAVRDRPLIVQYAYNRAFLNRPAMEALGVGTERFPQLPDTEFEKDEDGKPTGVVYGNTWTFVALETMVPQLTPDEEVSSLLYSINGLNRLGITSVIDNGSRWGYPRAEQIIDRLARDFRLHVRMPFVVLQLPETPASSMVEAQLEAMKKTPLSPGQNLYPALAYGHEYLGFGEVLEVETHDHENFDNPAVIVPVGKMHALVERDVAKLVLRRIPFRMHISYNENITPFLDALEKLDRTMPLQGLRWSLEHTETISEENIERVRHLGGGIALDHKMALHGDAFIESHGRDVALQTPRLRHLVESGVPLAMTTDAFRAATFNPWVGISWMVTGKSVSGSEVLAAEHRLSREEALKLFTSGAAWFMGAQSEMGLIAPGYLADFALLDKDYFEVPDNQITSVTSVLTVLDGHVVFGAQEFSGLAPALPAILPAWSPVKYFSTYYREQ